MTSSLNGLIWLQALAAAAAQQQGIALPAFAAQGMGSARSTSVAGGRHVTFKRRLVPPEQAAVDGIEWTLWLEHDDIPTPVAAFREPVEPQSEDISRALKLLKGWLLDAWTPDEARTAVGSHPRVRPTEALA